MQTKIIEYKCKRCGGQVKKLDIEEKEYCFDCKGILLFRKHVKEKKQ